jgi:hypothetical protein
VAAAIGGGGAGKRNISLMASAAASGAHGGWPEKLWQSEKARWRNSKARLGGSGVGENGEEEARRHLAAAGFNRNLGVAWPLSASLSAENVAKAAAGGGVAGGQSGVVKIWRHENVMLKSAARRLALLLFR